MLQNINIIVKNKNKNVLYSLVIYTKIIGVFVINLQKDNTLSVYIHALIHFIYAYIMH